MRGTCSRRWKRAMIDLSPAHLAIVERILAEHVPECEVRAFGSRATWSAKDYSDLDLAVVGDEPLSLGTVARLKEAFEESPLPMRVDVLDWDAIADGFREAIESDCVLVQEGTLPRVKDEWREMSLGEVVELKRGYDLPKRDRAPGPIPLVSSSGITDQHAEAKVKGPGVVTGRYGTLGKVFFIPSDFWPLNTTLYVRDFKGNDPRFISYLLRTLDFFAYSDKAAVPGLNRNHLHQEMVRVPPLEEQRAIARVLGALDDKIELNRRMSETLEEMARALFRSWFVDFDPVRAKVEGRPSGLPPDLDALFPASFEASELGEIPAGWEVKTLGDVAVERRQAVSPEAMPPETPYIGLDHMPKRSIALSAWGTAEGLASNKSSFEQGDILFGKLRPYFHKVGVAPLDGVCSTDIVVLSPKSPDWFGFVLGHASSDEFVDYTDAMSTGTRMPRTKWKDMARYVLPTPSEPVAEAFNERVQAWVTRIASAIHESRALSAQRDALLPRLLSGEVSVRDLRKVRP